MAQEALQTWVSPLLPVNSPSAPQNSFPNLCMSAASLALRVSHLGARLLFTLWPLVTV